MPLSWQTPPSSHLCWQKNEFSSLALFFSTCLYVKMRIPQRGCMIWAEQSTLDFAFSYFLWGQDLLRAREGAPSYQHNPAMSKVLCQYSVSPLGISRFPPLLRHFKGYCQGKTRVWHSIFWVAACALKILRVPGCSFRLLLFSWDKSLEAGALPTGRDPAASTELGRRELRKSF